MASANNFLFGFSTLVFPIVGSALVDWLGFRRACDVLSIVLLLNALIYFIVTVQDWHEERKEAHIYHIQEEEERALFPSI